MTVSTSTVFDLTPAEKLQLVEDLWDDLSTNPHSVPIHDWQKLELKRRKQALESNLDTTTTWEEAKDWIRAHHGR